MHLILNLLLTSLASFAIEKSTLNPTEASWVSSGKVTVVDLRETNELTEGVIKNSTNIAFSQFDKNNESFKKFVAQLPKDKEVWMYCQKGGRADKASDLLKSMGYKVRNIGGFAEIKALGVATDIKPALKF